MAGAGEPPPEGVLPVVPPVAVLGPPPPAGDFGQCFQPLQPQAPPYPFHLLCNVEAPLHVDGSAGMAGHPGEGWGRPEEHFNRHHGPVYAPIGVPTPSSQHHFQVGFESPRSMSRDPGGGGEEQWLQHRGSSYGPNKRHQCMDWGFAEAEGGGNSGDPTMNSRQHHNQRQDLRQQRAETMAIDSATGAGPSYNAGSKKQKCSQRAFGAQFTNKSSSPETFFPSGSSQEQQGNHRTLWYPPNSKKSRYSSAEEGDRRVRRRGRSSVEALHPGGGEGGGGSDGSRGGGGGGVGRQFRGGNKKGRAAPQGLFGSGNFASGPKPFNPLGKVSFSACAIV